MTLSEFGEEFGDVLLDKVEWMILGTVSSIISISIPSSESILFYMGEYGITGEYITFWLSTGLLVLSIIKILLACVDHALTIRQRFKND